MAKIYTKTGDAGETGLYGGSRIPKDDLRVECYGTLDEVNSAIGLAYSLVTDNFVKDTLRQIQKRLFVVGAQLASDDKGNSMLYDKISENDIQFLEHEIDKIQESITEQTNFIIPGGSTSAASIHVARTIARRLERVLIRLAREIEIEKELLIFINRLSDVLFILARAEEEYQLVLKIKDRVLRSLSMKKSNENSELEFWKKMSEFAEKRAKEIGIGIVFAAVDKGGNLVLLHRTDESLIASIDIATNKAYTSLVLRTSSDKVGELAQPGKELYGIGATNNGRIVTFGGGFPVIRNGEIVGAIGVSGGSVSQDMDIASYALNQ